jgi:hypothetical protein
MRDQASGCMVLAQMENPLEIVARRIRGHVAILLTHLVIAQGTASYRLVDRNGDHALEVAS